MIRCGLDAQRPRGQNRGRRNYPAHAFDRSRNDLYLANAAGKVNPPSPKAALRFHPATVHGGRTLFTSFRPLKHGARKREPLFGMDRNGTFPLCKLAPKVLATRIYPILTSLALPET